MEKTDMKFEEMLNSLEKVVKELENGEVDLDDAIEKYIEAMKLAKKCRDKLSNATEKVNKIMTDLGELKDFETEE